MKTLIYTELIKSAMEVRKHAHIPYSHYAVGAAFRMADGRIITGCNIENASYGLTVCAERVAVFKAISEGFHSFEALAIAVPGRKPMPPCGACLQVLSEFCNHNMPIVLVAAGSPGLSIKSSLHKLLPHAFALNHRSDSNKC